MKNVEYMQGNDLEFRFFMLYLRLRGILSRHCPRVSSSRLEGGRAGGRGGNARRIDPRAPQPRDRPDPRLSVKRFLRTPEGLTEPVSPTAHARQRATAPHSRTTRTTRDRVQSEGHHTHPESEGSNRHASQAPTRIERKEQEENCQRWETLGDGREASRAHRIGAKHGAYSGRKTNHERDPEVYGGVRSKVGGGGRRVGGGEGEDRDPQTGFKRRGCEERCQEPETTPPKSPRRCALVAKGRPISRGRKFDEFPPPLPLPEHAARPLGTPACAHARFLSARNRTRASVPGSTPRSDLVSAQDILFPE